MHRILACIVLLTSFLSYSQKAENLRAYLNEKQFYSPLDGDYLEVHIEFVGHTLVYKNVDEQQKAQVEIVQIVSLNDSIVMADKYLLSSPPIQDSLVENFYDIQRYALEPGEYDYELSVRDVYSEKEALSVQKKLEIKDFGEKVEVSDIVLAQKIGISDDRTLFSKVGYDVVPMLTNYYPAEYQHMPYYTEIYNLSEELEEGTDYLVLQRIYAEEMQSDADLEVYNRSYKYTVKGEVKPFAKSIDITLLPAGKYVLEVSVMDKEKEVLAKNLINFERNNFDIDLMTDYKDEIVDPSFQESITTDSLGYYVASLIPISSPAEVKNILQLLKSRDTTMQRKYMQSYWKKSARGENTFEAWMKYKAQVLLVEDLYASNFQVGFETDRGRVYLQYGAPNSIIQRPTSPSEYPYEIWQYDKIGKFSNRRFVFYNPDLVNNAYRLLHSDMVGELKNYRWKYYINSRTAAGNNIDDPSGGNVESHGSNAGRLYENY